MRNIQVARCGLVAVCLLATHARLEAQQGPAAPQPRQPIYVQAEQSRAYVLVGKTGFGHEHGVEGKIRQGFLQLGAASNAGTIEFDMSSFTADTKQARAYVKLAGETDAGTAKQVTDNMLGPDVLDAKRYPTATYVVKSALPAERSASAQAVQYMLDGDFTLHGVTRPLKVTADVQAAEGGWRVRTRFAVLQSSFGITPFTKAFGAIGVADRLDIFGDVLLVTAPAQAQTPANPPRR